MTMNFPGRWHQEPLPRTVSGKTATVTFNNNTSNVIAVSTSTNMTEIRLNYQGGTNLTSTFSGTRSRSVTGSGLYVSSVRVNMGGTLVTVNNPAGTSAPASFSPVIWCSNLRQPTSRVGWTGDLSLGVRGAGTSFLHLLSNQQPDHLAGHLHKYGGACLVNYLLKNNQTTHSAMTCGRTPHYPFHSVKQGAMLFLRFHPGSGIRRRSRGCQL